jgi:ferric-dicitrate binding protein FerR (iron transport regulator)
MQIKLRKSLASVGFLLLVAPFLGGATAAVDDEVVGKVTEIMGSAVALQDALPRVLKVDAPIHLGDVLSTGRGSRLHIKMVDDAEFSLGERSQFVVQEYFLKPDGKEGNAVIRLMEGASRATTGKIASLDNQPFVLKTEVATIGVRGTEFWGGLLDGVHQYALLNGRAIIVENKAGRVEITRIGDGTTVQSDAAAPVAPTVWESDKLNRAAAMTK